MEADLLTDVIDRRTARARLGEEIKRLAQRLLAAAILLWLLFSQVLLITQASGNRMFPAVKDGDLVIAFRLNGRYTKNDVVVYTASNAQCLGRVVAREQDVVSIDGTGKLLVNGTVQDGGILFPTWPGEGVTYPIKLKEGELFILGDHRTQAVDSRAFGPVMEKDVQGKVITLLRRRGL
ncbi:MAG: signal peptidase I [Clostridia bacterium]|nr:signal peptidase I [Clostridia bacterium]